MQDPLGPTGSVTVPSIMTNTAFLGPNHRDVRTILAPLLALLLSRRFHPFHRPSSYLQHRLSCRPFPAFALFDEQTISEDEDSMLRHS